MSNTDAAMYSRLGELTARRETVRAELLTFADADTLNAEQAARFTTLETELGEINTEHDKLSARANVVGRARDAMRSGRGVEHIGNGPAVHTRTHSNPYTGLTPGAGFDDTASGLRSRAVDLAATVADVPDSARAFVTDALDADRDPDALLARWALATGRDAYRSAFVKVLADPIRGHLLWDESERAAFQDVELVSSRAMGTGSGAAGAFMMPFFLDPAIMLTNSGVAAGIRGKVRNVATAGNTWNGVSSAGASFEWKAEAAEAADGAPTLAQPDVPLHTASVFVPFSVELEAASNVGELQRVMIDEYDVNVAQAIVNGTGTGQPNGIVTALSASIIALGTLNTLAASDVYGLQNALAPRFQKGASFAANLSTINTIAQMETANGAKQFPEASNSELLRRALVEDSTLGDVGTATPNASIAYGDFERGYVFATGVGTRIELVQHMLGANGRPTGERGYWLWARVGGDVVNASAIELLSVA